MEFVDFEDSDFFFLLKQHLAGHECREASGGTVTDPNKAMLHRNSHIGRKEKAKGTLLTLFFFQLFQMASYKSLIKLDSSTFHVIVTHSLSSSSKGREEQRD